MIVLTTEGNTYVSRDVLYLSTARQNYKTTIESRSITLNHRSMYNHPVAFFILFNTYRKTPFGCRQSRDSASPCEPVLGILMTSADRLLTRMCRPILYRPRVNMACCYWENKMLKYLNPTTGCKLSIFHRKNFWNLLNCWSHELHLQCPGQNDPPINKPWHRLLFRDLTNGGTQIF